MSDLTNEGGPVKPGRVEVNRSLLILLEGIVLGVAVVYFIRAGEKTGGAGFLSLALGMIFLFVFLSSALRRS